MGFTLVEIDEIPELSSQRLDARQVREWAEAKILELDDKVNDLLVMRDSLERVTEAECDSLLACSGTRTCPIRDAANE